MKIYLFCEGQTEKNVVEKFAALANPSFKGDGKAKVNNQMTSTLGPLIGKPDAIRVLIMRDLDKGEAPEDIVQSIRNAVQKMLTDRQISGGVDFQPHKAYPNVYLLSLDEFDLHLALHLALDKWHDSFINATIDDYVLDLALREQTASSLLRKKEWSTTPAQIIRKVTERIPALLQDNGIPLQEAKDYVRLYAAVIQAHSSPAIFAGKVVANASQEDKQNVFAPLLAALNFLEEPSS
ncbi:MAG: hypothetical protein KDD92_19825 [Caldilineaceae bacterium]|nr:hypothetical protein [Caldilineaceae bacterium]